MNIEDLLRRVAGRLPRPEFTRLRNHALFDWMNANAPGKAVLNLGSGVGLFDRYLSPEIQAINLDISTEKPKLDVIGDAHRLPFKDQAFDIVYSIAVLEHVRKPWIVAQEITRVLRPGGHVVLELPFLNTIHDQHDYFRFTDLGIRSLFDEDAYDAVMSQVGSGGGSFLSVFVLEYFQQFVPGKWLKLLWRFVMLYVLWVIKYLDLLIASSPRLRITANSFSAILRKR